MLNEILNDRGSEVAARTNVTTVMLYNLSEADADSYMLATQHSATWEVVRKIGGIRDLAQRPVLLFLLSNVLESLVKPPTPKSDVSVSWLYEAAVKMWLRRDRRARTLNEDQVFDYLEYRALELWRSIVLLSPNLGALVSNWLRGRSLDSSSIAILEDIGLLLHGGSKKGLPFSHYSFFEYFLARAVVRDILKYDATLLAGMNLVRMYTVNQFMIEQLSSAEFPKSEPADLPTFRFGAARVMLDPLSNSEFLSFMQHSGWRAGGVLWGSSKDRTSASGCGPLEGVGLQTFEWGVPTGGPSVPVTNVSWYDAATCARHLGGRLCTLRELSNINRGARPVHRTRHRGMPTWEWSSEWRDYARSLISVAKPGIDQVGGVNPDVRDSSIGFRVAWDDN